MNSAPTCTFPNPHNASRSTRSSASKPKSPTPAAKPGAAPASGPVHLSYHWQAPDDSWLEFDGERTPLPRDLAPGETVHHYLTLKAPPQPGSARLHLTLVQEGVGWFDQHGCPALIIPVSVEKSGKIESRFP